MTYNIYYITCYTIILHHMARRPSSGANFGSGAKFTGWSNNQLNNQHFKILKLFIYTKLLLLQIIIIITYNK